MSIFDIQTPQESVGFQFWKLHNKWFKQVNAVPVSLPQSVQTISPVELD